MQVAAVGDEVAVGIDHLVVLDRLEGVGRVDGGARQVVISPMPMKASSFSRSVMATAPTPVSS